jgi:hypothetical protein
MKPKTPRYSGSAHLQKLNIRLNALGRQAKEAELRGDFQSALKFSRLACSLAPQNPVPWVDSAVYSIKLEQWVPAIQFANRALKAKGNSLALYDALSHAWGGVRDWKEVGRWGLTALNMRLGQFSSAPLIEHDVLAPLPPPPSAATREQNLIAFSLFGANSKYCETAVLNVLDQPGLYPHWTCVFFVDDTVPSAIIERLSRGGRIIHVEDPWLLSCPKPMWRFLAYDLPDVHRVIFRDADSVISQREADAVGEWVVSDRRFHIMRDSSTHTELIMAGLWGVTAGAMPSMRLLVEDFLSRPVESSHFADQHFLRSLVWPYARQSVLQHDSHFGFLDGQPFPGGPMPDDFHVGYAEGSPFFTLAIAAPDNTPVVWALHENGHREQEICRYDGVVQGGKLLAHLPARYAKRLQLGQLSIACDRA